MASKWSWQCNDDLESKLLTAAMQWLGEQLTAAMETITSVDKQPQQCNDHKSNHSNARAASANKCSNATTARVAEWVWQHNYARTANDCNLKLVLEHKKQPWQQKDHGGNKRRTVAFKEPWQSNGCGKKCLQQPNKQLSNQLIIMAVSLSSWYGWARGCWWLWL